MNTPAHASIRGLKIRKKSLDRLSLIVFFSFLFSMQPWFLYGIVPSFVYVALALILVFPFYLRGIYFKKRLRNNEQQILLLLTIACLSYALNLNINGVISYIPTIFYLYILLKIKDSIRIYIIQKITKYMAILLSISLFFYILYLIKPFSFSTFYPPNGAYKFGFANQYVNIINTTQLFYRFQSIFIEPGHMIIGIFPLAFINNFNIRNKYVAIIFISILFSLSLAGYILTIISLFYISITKRKIYTIIISTTILCSLLYIGYNYATSHQNSTLTLAILNRLEYDSTDGTISGDNRVTKNTDLAYRNVINSSNIWLGTNDYDNTVLLEGNNGYKVILIRMGLAQLFLMTIAYLSVPICFRSKRVLYYVLFLLLMISQNYYPYWSASLINLIFGATLISRQNK